MLKRLKESWRALRSGPPGQRFRQHYQRRKRIRASALQKVLIMGGGFVITAVGLFMLPAPGPGIPIVFIGATMVAGESYAAAALLDWTELRVRKVVTWARVLWEKSALPQRALLVVAALLATATGAFATYRLVFAG